MIKKVNISFFSDSSQIMLELGRNIGLVAIFKNLTTSSLIRTCDVIIVILMSRQLEKGKAFMASLFLDELISSKS